MRENEHGRHRLTTFFVGSAEFKHLYSMVGHDLFQEIVEMLHQIESIGTPLRSVSNMCYSS